jgi:hypothetical protein
MTIERWNPEESLSRRVTTGLVGDHFHRNHRGPGDQGTRGSGPGGSGPGGSGPGGSGRGTGGHAGAQEVAML